MKHLKRAEKVVKTVDIQVIKSSSSSNNNLEEASTHKSAKTHAGNVFVS